MSKNRRETRKIELVETNNIAMSLDRLNGPPYDGGQRLKRAVYHAFGMSNCVDKDMMTRIRMALELP